MDWLTNLKTGERSFLIRLNTLLGDCGKDTVYPCIRDLIEHGLDLARFSAGETKPQRQDITQYLAAWSRHAGLSEEESCGWLLDYCTGMLASITTRSPAAIRHSTKSNLRYIYRSELPFLCECENNRFQAQCSSDCPVYPDMQAKLREKASEALNPKPLVRPPPPLPERAPSVKEVYREQFQAGMRLILGEIEKGTNQRRIVELLNERGLKTRTGRKWQSGILSNELANLKKSHDPTQDGRKDAGLPDCPGTEQNAAPNDSPAALLDNSE